MRRVSTILTMAAVAMAFAGRETWVSGAAVEDLQRAAQQSGVAVSDSDWCRDTERDWDRDRDVFCEVRELSAASLTQLTITDTPNGSIRVIGGSRRGAVVRVRVVASARTMDEARALAREVRVTFENGTVRTDGPNRNGGWDRDRSSWSVSYRAEVPGASDLELDTSNGSIAVDGVSGRIIAGSSNGSVRLTDVGGRVSGRTSNGSVHVSLSGSSWQGEGLDVSTSNGSVQIDLPRDFNARVVASTGNGSISVDGASPSSDRRGDWRRSRSIDTTLGSGGPRIEARSSNGSVRVQRR